MFVLGFYYLDHEISRSLTQFMLFGLVAFLLILGINPLPGNLLLLIPLIYILVAAGLVMLFSQWYEIFPRNPIARMAVFMPTIILLGAVIWYHHTRYFVAGPSSPVTVAVFPPLSPTIKEFVDLAGEGRESVILTTDEETQIALASVRLYPHVQITSVASAAIGQPNLAITSSAYEQLNNEQLRQANRADLLPLSSSLSTTPVVLWYTISE